MGPGHEPRRLDIGTGLSLAYVQTGDPAGPVVLLLHAWDESLRCFDRLVPLLPESFRVIAVDQRGHGDADKPAHGYDLGSLATDLDAFLAALDVSSAVLAGTSSGGYVAQQVAVQSPDRVAGLVLIGAPQSLRVRPEFADDIEELTDPVDPGWARDYVSSFPLLHEVPQWYLDDRVRDAVRIPAHVWRSSLTGITTSPAPTDTGTIAAPTLILWGDRDSLLPRQSQLDLAARIPGGTLVVYDGVGHLVLWEQPGRVATDLARFVQRIRA